MKQYNYTEFVQYSNSFTKEKNDFYGELSPLGEKETKLFFKKYAAAMKDEYGEDCLYRKAVDKKQLEATVEALKGSISDGEMSFFASKRRKNSGYKHWQLYTERATVSKNTVTLADDYKIPTAAAKCEFPKSIKKLSLSLFFDEEYRRPIPGGAIITTPGKMIDLRCGIEDSVRLFFAEDGKLIARKDERGNIYQYSDLVIGEYPIGEEFTLDFEFFADSCTVTLGGTSNTLPYLLRKAPDTLFLSGGLQPTSFWRVSLLSSEFEGEEFVDLFGRDEEEYPEEKIGNVTLPYCIGTHKDKDKELILRASFNVSSDNKHTLFLESLDPGGEVFVNERSVAKIDSFAHTYLSLDGYVKKGENSLEIRVAPRAPELNYVWHRHNDPYNGWFSLSARVISGGIVPTSLPYVITNGNPTPESFTVSWDTELELDCNYKAYVRSSYPKCGEYELLEEGKLEKGKLSFTKILDFELWTPETPNLYEIKIALFDKGVEIFEKTVETGFRTIVQKDGAIYLNGEKTVLKGALNMQFLPPYENVPINHVCPSFEEICEQAMALKNLNGNCLRLHQLGHGSSDKRFGEICDRLGIMLIWTTRAIDSAEQILWNRSDTEPWRLAEIYKQEMIPFLNHPSIIMWEGSNELHSGLSDLDRLYDAFVRTVKEVDTTRLICPVSHLYYGGGLYGGPESTSDYYNNDGTKAADGEDVRSSFGWLDSSVVRSAHTYSLLLGYGCPWRDMVTQNWMWQDELLLAKDKAYIVSEFASIGRQNPNTEGAKEYIDKASYELPNEKSALGYCFSDDEWELSQAYQALCTDMSIRQLRRLDADGMLWCALWSGANNGSYLKPIIDFAGYRKLAFYRMRDAFGKCLAANTNPDALLYPGYKISPILTGLTKGADYSLSVTVLDESGEAVTHKNYESFTADSDIVTLKEFDTGLTKDGFYKIKYSLYEV